MNPRSWSRKCLVWLALSLAFWLPAAQAVAGLHAVSHVSDRSTDGLVHLAQCHLCLAAAALDGGAPPAAPWLPPLGDLAGSTRTPAPDSAPTAGPAPPYPARAPPAAA